MVFCLYAALALGVGFILINRHDAYARRWRRALTILDGSAVDSTAHQFTHTKETS